MQIFTTEGMHRVFEMSQLRAKDVMEKDDSISEPETSSYPMWRKCLIVATTSWLALTATFSSTSLFTASTQVASQFSISVNDVNLSSAGVLLAMGLSSFIWRPIGAIVGRSIAYNCCIVFLIAFTIGAALSSSASTFIAMRVLSGLQGTYFHVAGQSILAEHFPPLKRGTATGFFLAGTVLGPPLGPFISGIIVTYSSWRVILWMQAAMAGLGFVMSLLFIPYTVTVHETEKQQSFPIREAFMQFKPSRVLKLMRYPNIILTDFACGLLSWSQYSLLSAPRHILSTRFHLTSPMLAGLFYIAPAGGFLLGTIIGGAYSDRTVKKWIKKREGIRLPQDRLNSGIVAFFLIIPVSSLTYGWTLNCQSCSTGGLALPIVTAFCTAAGLLAAFASLNTYCAEVLPANRLEVITGKYFIQYIFAAVASASSVPLIDKVGIGLSSTISTLFVILGGALTWQTARKGKNMQDWVNAHSIKH